MTVPVAQEKLLKVALSALAADVQGGQLIEESHIIDTVKQYSPIAGPNLDASAVAEVIQELTRRFNVWSGRAGVLVGNDRDHLAWLTARKSEIRWLLWDRYRVYIEQQLPPSVVTELDATTEMVLSLLEDPGRPGSWRRQGLVVGHVQSGKTGNYTGLLCKAADAGYKVVVVLSGIHSSLRAQTQIRLDEGFLGYARAFGGQGADRVPVGVGLIDAAPLVDSVTTRDERGDFSRTKAQGFQIHAGGNVLLFVVKKNVRVLNNLIEWAKLSAKKPLGNGRFVVGEAPLLVIDDEADQASIDLKVQPFDENNQPDPDHDPSKINGAIRRLLEAFERRAYVGYTATPFANVFIHPDARTNDEGEDLYPRDFIVNLSTPSDYFGPTRVFGDDDAAPPGDVPSLVRFVQDADDWVPAVHNNSVIPRYEGADKVPPSLDRAVRSFVLSCAARRARGDVNSHKSMLVHVTRFTAVQERVHAQVRQLLEDLRDRWRARETSGNDPLLAEMLQLWEDDFLPTSDAHDAPHLPWAIIEPHVWPVLELIKVNLINAKASDALIYQEHRQHGLHVIAIGGDKLSRGLTLEGLSVSYFLRSARMYDTLMQMGRWFGYREGYEDLCRLYLTEEIAEWYEHITEAAEELRAEFDRMVLVGGTPNDYGLRVRKHPVLAITGRLRPGMPTVTTSLSATPFEPTVLLESAAAIQRNWDKTKEFIRQLGKPDEFPVIRKDPDAQKHRGAWAGAVLWRDVPGPEVLRFFKDFDFADKHLVRTAPQAVKSYIANQLARSELAEWTVVALGKDSSLKDKPTPEMSADLELDIAGAKVWSVLRTRYRQAPGVYVVKRLGSQRDESIDLYPEEWQRVDRLLGQRGKDPQRPEESTQGRLVRSERPPRRGLLILYLLTPPRIQGLAEGVPLVGPYISFPDSKGAEPVTYTVSYRYWENEIRGVE